tara:strand:+ start:669 stop:917 length:249 start_codon:yes stop_codon:yes gene_type:complete
MIDYNTHLLIVAMEEAGEFIQACSKVYRHNGGEHEVKCLSEEVGDVQALINLLTEKGLIDLNIANNKRIAREYKLREQDESR